MIASLALSLLIAFLMAWEARRKGYSPWLWFFAGGLLGYAILACLPATTSLLGRERPGALAKRRTGNWIGAIISILSLAVTIEVVAWTAG